MYYTVYKITNKINGKVYIGTHKTKNLDDGYMGSGKYLKHSINKHGISNFKKEILFIYDNSQEMFAKEAELVTKDFIAEQNTYNLKIGGYGGFDYLNSSDFDNPTRTKEHMEKMTNAALESYKNNPRLRKERRELWSKIAKRNHASKKIKYNTFTGKKHTDESKKKMSVKAKQRFKDSGEKTPTEGKKWAYNLEIEESKLVDKNTPLKEGWSYGRIVDFKTHKERLKKEVERKELLAKEEKRKQRLKIENVLELYNDFISGRATSLREFANERGYKFQTLSKWFLSYIPEYNEKSKERKSFKNVIKS